MHKRFQWIISVFMAVGLLLTGTVAAASHNPKPSPNRVAPAAGTIAVRSQSMTAPDNADSSAIQLVAFTSGPNSGKDSIRVCGIVTCSTYYSHQATVELAAKLTWYSTSTANALTLAGLVCSGVAGVVGAAIISAGCLLVAVAAFGSSLIFGNIIHAADTAGCVRWRSPRGIPPNFTPVVYADHSAICHSMDP